MVIVLRVVTRLLRASMRIPVARILWRTRQSKDASHSASCTGSCRCKGGGHWAAQAHLVGDQEGDTAGISSQRSMDEGEE